MPDEEIWDGNDLTADAAVVAPDAVEVEAEFWATQQFVPVYVSLSCELSSLGVQERGEAAANCALFFRVCLLVQLVVATSRTSVASRHPPTVT